MGTPRRTVIPIELPSDVATAHLQGDSGPDRDERYVPVYRLEDVSGGISGRTLASEMEALAIDEWAIVVARINGELFAVAPGDQATPERVAEFQRRLDRGRANR